MTSTVQASFPSVPDKSHLAQLVQAGQNTVKQDVTPMNVDVSFDKQVIVLMFLYLSTH